MLRSLLLVGLLAASVSALGRTQSIAVKGKLICEGKAASGVTVKLYDEDGGLSIGKDDLIASGKTNAQGEYMLSGHHTEFTTIDPKLNIYHDCNDGIKPCQRKFTIYLPKSYVTAGKVPKQTYDAGTMQLAGKYPKESRDCLH